MSQVGRPREDRSHGPAAPDGGGRVRQLGSVLRGWSRRRVGSAVLAALGAGLFLIAATGLAADGSGWAAWTAVTAAALLAGALAGSYVDAPIGAAATFCDLRWPVLGLFGVIWATSPREAAPATQTAVGVLAVAVMAWALHARVELERKATRARALPDPEVEACTDCRPLFPAKPPRRP